MFITAATSTQANKKKIDSQNKKLIETQNLTIS
jgi:hypothetical protein